MKIKKPHLIAMALLGATTACIAQPSLEKIEYTALPPELNISAEAGTSVSRQPAWFWFKDDRLAIYRSRGTDELTYVHDFSLKKTIQQPAGRLIRCLSADYSYQLEIETQTKRKRWVALDATGSMPKTLSCYENGSSGMRIGHGAISQGVGKEIYWEKFYKGNSVPLPESSTVNIRGISFNDWTQTYRAPIGLESPPTDKAPYSYLELNPATGTAQSNDAEPWLTSLGLGFGNQLKSKAGDLLVVQPSSALPAGIYLRNSNTGGLTQFYRKKGAVFVNARVSPSGCRLAILAYTPGMPASVDSAYREELVFNVCQIERK